MSAPNDRSPPEWWYPESRLFTSPDYSGVDFMDREVAAAYDQQSGSDPSEDAALLDALGVDVGSTLVELGGGSGGLAIEAARRCRRVVAVDLSPAMSEQVAGRVAALALSNLEVVTAGFLTYRHEGPPVDFVVTRNALHHLPDFWKVEALRRIARLLRPGGVLFANDLIFSFRPAQADQYITAWLDSRPVGPTGFSRAVCAAHLREEFSTYSWLFERMLEESGFDIRDAVFSENRIFASYTCTRR